MFGRKYKRVYVLGAGPAGLLAAHAAMSLGYSVVVFTHPDVDGTPRKSELLGCQYLHDPIPGITGRGERTYVNYNLVGGDADSYRRKVYGTEFSGQVSVDEYGPAEAHPAWDLRAAYDKLWGKWLPVMVPGILTSATTPAFVFDRKAFVVSSVPAPALCLRPGEHKFPTQDIWAMGEFGLPYYAPRDTVECNGADAPRWYRAATVFGHSTIEWPAGARPPVSGVKAVSKPLSTDCDCHVGPRWLRVGRFGTWTKGVLVHTAYANTLEALR